MGKLLDRVLQMKRTKVIVGLAHSDKMQRTVSVSKSINNHYLLVLVIKKYAGMTYVQECYNGKEFGK